MSENEMFKLINSINTSLANLNASAITTNQILVRMQGEINSISKELCETKMELKQDIANVRAELHETKAELKRDIADVREELQETKAELKQDIENVKVELNQNIEDAKTYLCDVVDEMTNKLYEMHNQEIESLKKELLS